MSDPTSQPNMPLNPPPGIEDTAHIDPVYSNLVRIAHSPSELVFDFAHLLPAEAPARLRARIIMSPLGAKLFLHALAENLGRFEAMFGEIKLPGDGSLAESLFRPPEH